MRQFLALISLFGFAIMLSHCSHNEAREEAWSTNPNLHTEKTLSQTLAAHRATLVHDVRYELSVDLDKNTDSYSGAQKISFSLSKIEGDLPLDFRGGDVKAMTINGSSLDADKILRGPVFIKLPENFLKVGENVVEIKFTHAYSHDGAGLHRYLDHEDNNVYLYTQFEPFDANGFAPFFDQPDIKAVMQMTVNAPKEWVVITNTNEAKRDNSGSMSHWQFNATPKISTYLFALIAGPYAQFDGEYKGKKMRLFARKAMAKYVEAKEWLKITAQGLDFYGNYFGIEYPFEKFDQIVVPEFNAGAMENVGAITFTERLLHRSGATRADRVLMYDVVLHEMAHQWFGDLVTMKWWNNLWLNESFATAMSYIAEERATEYKETRNLSTSGKAAAYREDQMITTHPISAIVHDTNSSYTNFDSITYAKGAAVLRELYFYVGDEAFRKALNYYFRKHSYQNADLNDFIAAFNETMNTDMNEWFKNWLTTTGVDEIAATYSCSTMGVTVQVRNNSKIQRIHSLKIGRYRFVDGKVIADGTTDYRTTKPDGEFTIPSTAENKIACPDMIYANVDDQAYVKLVLDDKSVSFLQAHINDLPDVMLRQLVWADLWQMVRDQKFKLADFAAMDLKALQVENNVDILKAIASRGVGTGYDFNNVYYYWPRTTDEEKRSLADIKRDFSQVLWSRMTHETKNSDLEKLFTDFYLRSAGEDAQISRLEKMTKTLKDQDRRWSLLNSLCALGSNDCMHLVDQELKHDKSDMAQKAAVGCRAARPEQSVKREFLAKLAEEKSPFPISVSRNVTTNLFPVMQRDLINDFASDIYKDFSDVWVPKRDEGFQINLAATLTPVSCQSSPNTLLDMKLQGEGAAWPSTIRKSMLQVWDEDSRCIKVRQYNSGPSHTTKVET